MCFRLGNNGGGEKQTDLRNKVGGRTDGAINEVDVSNERNERAKDESAGPVTSEFHER